MLGSDLAETIGAGVLTNDFTSLGLWLADPQKVKPGCHMPNFHLTQDEITALADYLQATR